ncbi:autotransporter assembly complex protein TamA [Aureimonas pseudogalii]|uniref:Translocation and assembly module TamA n=1 Tax=Aureimonas pseudogalii TaxID=1744844 RepID=A0A7W6EC85_9HYPH|nr:autotransporter assembly complex family protein [Aureimonas pseudogalii]MBB3996612.1 translocation and assembly module TamA [Aureimonas pseudogalii]
MFESLKRRRLPVLFALLAATLAGPLVPAPAQAFEIFGITLFGKKEADPAITDPVEYTATLTVAPENEDLQEVLEKASSLVADEDEPVSGSLGLLAKAKNDRRRLVAALYENSRYDGLVTIRIEGRDVADLLPDAAFDTSRPVPVEITVDPGQLFTVGRVSIDANGVPLDPKTYDLAPGSAADSTRILAAEGRILEALRNEGRPFVALTERSVVADSATATVDLSLRISPGEPVPFGQTFVDGTTRMDPGFVAFMAGIEPGTPYSTAALETARKRLVDLNVFSNVSVRASDAQAADGTLPLQVTVAERKRHVFGAGATFSNTEGAGANAYWEDRNVFGRAESLRIEGAVSRIGANTLSDTGRETDGFDYRLAGVFRKPGVLGPDSVYVGSLIGLKEQPLAYDRTSVAFTNGVEYSIDARQRLTVNVVAEYETITDYLVSDEEFIIASVPVTYTFDSRDDKLNPTSGFLAKLAAEPGYEINGSVPFVKGRADASAYFSFDDDGRFVLAGRVGYGAVVGADLQEVPNDRRFYAGGGGSVRGYVFQSIGPYYPSIPLPGTNPNFVDTPTGGLSVFEASAELRFKVTDNIQIVPFVDAGTVGEDLAPDFGNLKIGAGVGARYMTGFGPIRVDVGIPLDPGPRDGSFQIYAGIGQAF